MKPTGRPGLTLGVMAFLHVFLMVVTFAVTALAIAADDTFPSFWIRVCMLPVMVLFLLSMVLLVPATMRGRFLALVRRIPVPRRYRKPGQRLEWFSTALNAISAGDIFKLLALSVASHVFFIMQQAFCAYAVGIQLSPATMAWLWMLAAISVSIPVSIGGLGLREAGMAAALPYYGVPQEQAIGYSLVVFAAVNVALGIVGGMTELYDLAIAMRRPLKK